MAVGVQGGVQVLAMLALLAHEQEGQEGCMLALDASNAYNACSRDALLEHVTTHQDGSIRAIGQLVYVLYAAEFDVEGMTFKIAEGGMQGDPLLPILFALAMQPTVFKLDKGMKDRDTGRTKNVGAQSFLDDLSLRGTTKSTLKGMEEAEEDLERRLGIRLNAKKSKMLTKNTEGAREVLREKYGELESEGYKGPQ
ncbi:hypothetical protein TrRE_jg7083, partial [Triparma retinervis]